MQKIRNNSTNKRTKGLEHVSPTLKALASTVLGPPFQPTVAFAEPAPLFGSLRAWGLRGLGFRVFKGFGVSFTFGSRVWNLAFSVFGFRRLRVFEAEELLSFGGLWGRNFCSWRLPGGSSGIQGLQPYTPNRTYSETPKASWGFRCCIVWASQHPPAADAVAATTRPLARQGAPNPKAETLNSWRVRSGYQSPYKTNSHPMLSHLNPSRVGVSCFLIYKQTYINIYIYMYIRTNVCVCVRSCVRICICRCIWFWSVYYYVAVAKQDLARAFWGSRSLVYLWVPTKLHLWGLGARKICISESRAQGLGFLFFLGSLQFNVFRVIT